MENSIVTIDTNNYTTMAKAMGMAIDDSSPKKSNNLARLKIEHKAIMGTAEVNGKSTNVEVISGGHYKLDIPEKEVIYAPTAKIRTFVQRFMYKRFISNSGAKAGEPSGKYQKTIMADSLNKDLKDNDGGFNCGKPAGWIEDFNSLPQEKRDLIKQIKRVRVLFGLVTLENPVDSNGSPVSLEDTPFIWEIDNRDAFKIVGQPIASLAKMKRLPVQHKISFATEKKELPTGISFYLPTTSLDASKSISLKEKDQDLFADFMAWIQNYNDYICAEWDKNTRSTMKQEDIETVEGFMEIETGNKA